MNDPHLIIPGRVPSHKNNYSTILRGAMRFKALKDFANWLLNWSGRQCKTVMGTLCKILIPGIVHKAKMKAWIKHACACVVAQRGESRYNGWVHVMWRYYPPDNRRIDNDSVSTGLCDILQDKWDNVKIVDQKEKIRTHEGYFPDDKWVAHFDGSRTMLPDKENPRLEVWVWPYAPGEGEYRG